MGRDAHAGQLQKAQLFTGLKGEEALTAYKRLMEERVAEAAANTMTAEENLPGAKSILQRRQPLYL